VSTPLFWVVVAAIALIEGLIVVTALRAHVNSNRMWGTTGGGWVEVVWTLLPSLILVAVAVLTLRLIQGKG
jgi:heme/copper-type cytochrome/quinol oxidase subunit 2